MAPDPAAPDFNGAPVAPGSPSSMAPVPLLPSPGRDPRSQKRAKDRVKRQPARGQSVSGKQTNGTPSFLHSSLSPQASAEHEDLGIGGIHNNYRSSKTDAMNPVLYGFLI